MDFYLQDPNRLKSFGILGMRYSECQNLLKIMPDLIFETNLRKLTAIKDGKTWKSRSGSSNYEALPKGRYLVRSLRIRPESAYKVGETGFSLNLIPLFVTSRTLLRIHPDGNLPGTKGCIGIQGEENSKEAFKYFKKKFGSLSELTLEVR